MPIKVQIDTAEFVAIEARIRKAAKEILGGSALKKEVGEFAVERLKYQTRIGKPFNQSSNLPDLAPATVKNRQYLAKHNTTHPTFSAGFSNLTITGELLDSLSWSDEGDTLLKLVFTGNHKPYKKSNGQYMRRKAPLTNETLAGYLAEKGFYVFDKSLQSNQQFINRIKTICMRYIRRGLRIRNAIDEY